MKKNIVIKRAGEQKTCHRTNYQLRRQVYCAIWNFEKFMTSNFDIVWNTAVRLNRTMKNHMDWMLFSYIMLLHMRFFTFTSEYKGFFITCSLFDISDVKFIYLFKYTMLLRNYMSIPRKTLNYRGFSWKLFSISWTLPVFGLYSYKYPLFSIQTQNKWLFFVN